MWGIIICSIRKYDGEIQIYGKNMFFHCVVGLMIYKSKQYWQIVKNMCLKTQPQKRKNCWIILEKFHIQIIVHICKITIEIMNLKIRDVY